MKKVSLVPYFFIAFFSHFALSGISSTFPVLYFAPFFTTCYSKGSLFHCIWLSFFIGIFLDMCTASTPMGFYPLCTIFTTLALHRFKIYFLEEKPLPFALYTALYSFTYTLLFTLMHTFIDPVLSITPLYFLLDCVLLPLLDTAYHLIFFTLPILSYQFITSREQKLRLILLKRRILSNFPKRNMVFKK